MRFCGSCGALCNSEGSDTETYWDQRPITHLGSKSEGRFPFGTVLSGRYRVLNLVGHGGMGEVYRALDLKLDQIVAIKLLPEAKAADPAYAARLLSEVPTEQARRSLIRNSVRR